MRFSALFARKAWGRPAQRRFTASVFAVAALAAGIFALFGHGALAAGPDLGLEAAQSAGLTTVDIRTFVARIIKVFLTLLGLIAVVLMMYAGFLWMTAGGNDEKVKTAKKIITNATIGLIIIASAYAIVSFLFNALTGASSGGISGSGNGGSSNPLFSSNRGSDQLGNGIIEYHYPEPGQSDVPRNTKISITFKKPLALSSVFRNYNDKGTYAMSDDILCSSGSTCDTGTPVTATTQLELNTDNVKLVANSSLAAGGSGTIDQQFTNRYPAAASVDATARVTVTATPFEVGQSQTLVIRPLAPIGSGSSDVNYRLALRGGDNGIRVWSAPVTGTEPTAGAAFKRAYADGGYYWSFTTGTTIDTEPPKVVAVEPRLTNPPGVSAASVLDRNQLLQIYFSEPIDPTTATGNVGAPGGVTALEVVAVCQPGTFGPGSTGTCVFNNGQPGTVMGSISAGNRSKTLEFTPTAPCEGVSENSCGEKIYCLPKNVRLTVRALAATVGADGNAAIASNGVVDMSDNSFDGNGDGTSQGPQPPAQPNGRVDDYYRNAPPSGADGLLSVSDTARWDYLVGSDVDLVAPYITQMDPPPPPEYTTSYPNGPSNVPPLLNPTITWSKAMSISSMRTGRFDETLGNAVPYEPEQATLFLRSRECAKNDGVGACPNPPSQCPCSLVEPPGFFIDAGEPIRDEDGTTYTKMSFMHPVRPFYTANDLGYTDEDIANYPDNVPQYVPIARAQIRDTKQNCFWPSKFVECTTSASGQTSCCNRTSSPDTGFVSECSP